MDIDELEWPNDAEFYIKPLANNKAGSPFFARSCDSAISGGKVGIKVSGEAYHVYETYWEVINRPTPAWKDGIPPEETECEVAVLGDRDYMWCLIKAIRGGAAWITTKNSDIVIRTDFAVFRPLQPTMRDKALSVVHEAMDTTYIDGGKVAAITDAAASFYAAAAVDALLESFDLTEKKK